MGRHKPDKWQIELDKRWREWRRMTERTRLLPADASIQALVHAVATELRAGIDVLEFLDPDRVLTDMGSTPPRWSARPARELHATDDAHLMILDDGEAARGDD